MPVPLLATKLYLPRPRAGLVSRPRLVRRLVAAAEAKLVLVSAPAGFGKTTLLTEWLASGVAAPTGERVVAWLSLDDGDNDPASFWAYAIAALQTAVPGIGAGEAALLASSQPPPIQRLLATLLNDLDGPGPDVVLVLDDYHWVEAREILDAMTFLLDHLPPRLHLVIASRADPTIPLARLRARGDLVEIRSTEMRFTPNEAAAYLTGAMGLNLTRQDVAALEERTEGWIAALQLAALSMQGRDDVSAFIAGFAGDDRYIVDYLAEEVLQQQPLQVRDFLLRTSVLGRLNGSLCDAVTGGHGGRSTLESLDRGNLFLMALDDRRESYRYHHLFADVLRARLRDESPDLERELHRRASDWYAETGDRAEAIEHAMSAGDAARAADLIELAMRAMRRDRQEGQLRRWLQLLPAEVIGVRPVLSNGYAGALLATGDVEAVEANLCTAERWLDLPPDQAGGMVVVDDFEFRRLPAAVAVHRAGLALVTGDLPGTVAHARRALDLLVEDKDLGRGAATALIGLASWWSGDLESGRQAYADCLVSMQRAGHVSDVFGCSIALADIQVTQGRLRDAMRTYEQALRLAPGDGRPALRGTADMYVGIGALLLERNDVGAAVGFLDRSEQLGELNGLPQNQYRWRVAMARVREVQGDLAGAADLLTEAERAYVGDFSPDVRPVPAVRARVRIRQGRVADALDWAHQRGLSVDDDLTYLREYEHVTLARALLARDRIEPAGTGPGEVVRLLDRLLRAAEEGRRTGSVIEVLVLQAVAHRARGDVPAASAALGRAVELAEPEGYARIFLDEGQALTELLAATARRRIAPDYVHGLLTALNAGHAAGHAAGNEVGNEDRPPSGIQLIQPLSPRELDVLRLLGTDLGGPEIARELVVSLNTVRTHTKNIYAKLGVTNRRAAVRIAADLQLIPAR